MNIRNLPNEFILNLISRNVMQNSGIVFTYVQVGLFEVLLY